MPITKISISDFILRSKTHPVLDVRSPGEYNHAHIPNAFSLPLFTDEERKIVGTSYKKEGKEKAIRIGLDFFGVKMNRLLDEALAFTKTFYQENTEDGNKTVIVHCWRGGMRSAGVAWLLDLYGFNVFTVIGGYKAYRNWVLNQFEIPYNIMVVGGYTGSGKTNLLEILCEKGEQVIDLEKIASHKGSTFGALGMPSQPTQEMFENLLADNLYSVILDDSAPIWMEDESRRIGQLNIPLAFYTTMRNSPLSFIEIPFEERLNYLVSEYGKFDFQAIKDGILRIQKRLGGLETKRAVQFLEAGDITSSFSILLLYYDKCYLKGINNRDPLKGKINKIPAPKVTATENINLLLQLSKNQNERSLSL